MANASLALFLTLNLILFTLTSGCRTCSSPPIIPTPTTPPSGTTPPPSTTTCPIDALKLGICADVLRGLLGIIIGTPPITPCCSLIEGLLDLEAAVCLCTAIKANVLGVNLNIPLSLTLLLNVCGERVPSGFQCA